MEDWRNCQNPSGYNRSAYCRGESFYKIQRYLPYNYRSYNAAKAIQGYNPSGAYFESMYQQRPNNVAQSQADTRLTVADILSSMANGEAVTPTTYAALQFSSGIPTATTPTLTPTTLSNIEQTFIELQSVPSHVQNQAGFVPPLIRMDSNNSEISHDSYQSSDKSDNDWNSTPSARRHPSNNIRSSIMSSNTTTTTTTAISSTSTTKIGRNTGGRKPIKDDKLTPEEEERRRVRRERNKLAAARCRKRRLDHTNCLILETEGLEEKKASLQNEIQMLQNEKEELEFILQKHKQICKRLSNGSNPPTSTNHILTNISRPTSLSVSSVHSSNNHGSKMSISVAEATGISITTPSQIFSYENLIDGGTGLTPTGLTPIIPSCSSEVQKSSGSEHSSPEITSPTLVSL